MTDEGYFFVFRLRKMQLSKLLKHLLLSAYLKNSDEMFIIGTTQNRKERFCGRSEQIVHNEVYIERIVYCSNVLVQICAKSHRTSLQISCYLKATLWKLARIWNRKIKGVL